MSSTNLGKVLVVIPTYNERENLPLIVAGVRAAAPEVYILVADDNSPDGTGEVLMALLQMTWQFRYCIARTKPA